MDQNNPAKPSEPHGRIAAQSEDLESENEDDMIEPIQGGGLIIPPSDPMEDFTLGPHELLPEDSVEDFGE